MGWRWGNYPPPPPWEQTDACENSTFPVALRGNNKMFNATEKLYCYQVLGSVHNGVLVMVLALAIPRLSVDIAKELPIPQRCLLTLSVNKP